MSLYQQFALDFPKDTCYDHTSFALSAANQEAYNWLMAKDTWGSFGLILVGNAGSGKTHLAHIWQQATQARFITSHDLKRDLSKLIHHHKTFIIEDIEQFNALQNDLFHILNVIREEQKLILLTVTDSLKADLFSLNDLMSRLRSLPRAIIHLPDDILRKAIMIKRFADLQLQIDDRILNYLLTRSERSYISIHHIIDKIYHLSKLHQQKITLPLVRDIV